jgi:hypothetical protein
MSKLELSLDEVIMSDKKKKQFREKAKQTVRGGSGKGGRATGGGRTGGGGGGGGRQQGGGQQQQERRQGGGVQRGQRRTRGQRATPYDKVPQSRLVCIYVNHICPAKSHFSTRCCNRELPPPFLLIHCQIAKDSPFFSIYLNDGQV